MSRTTVEQKDERRKDARLDTQLANMLFIASIEPGTSYELRISLKAPMNARLLYIEVTLLQNCATVSFTPPIRASSAALCAGAPCRLTCAARGRQRDRAEQSDRSRPSRRSTIGDGERRPPLQRTGATKRRRRSFSSSTSPHFCSSLPRDRTRTEAGAN